MLSFLVAIRVFFRSRSDTALEVLALRQQVAVRLAHENDKGRWRRLGRRGRVMVWARRRCPPVGTHLE